MNKKLSAAKVVNYLIFPNPCLSFLYGYNKVEPRGKPLRLLLYVLNSKL